MLFREWSLLLSNKIVLTSLLRNYVIITRSGHIFDDQSGFPFSGKNIA